MSGSRYNRLSLCFHQFKAIILLISVHYRKVIKKNKAYFLDHITYKRHNCKKMRKKIIYLFFGGVIFLFFCLLVLDGGEASVLEILASIEPPRLSRGQEGKVVFKFKIDENVRIIPLPHFIIEFEPSDALVLPKNFFSSSDLGIKILEENDREFLDLSEKVEVPFTVKLEAKRGRYLLKGKVRFFALSQTEDWCLKTSEKFSVSFYTLSSVYKKK